MPNVFKVNTVHSRTLMVFSFFRKKCLGFVIFFSILQKVENAQEF